MKKDAVISKSGLHRYYLSREWDSNLPSVTFMMLNPSIADAEIDDKTILKCIGFAKRLGFGKIIVVNCFSYRATNPDTLHSLYVGELNGPESHIYINKAFQESEKIIVGFGKHAKKLGINFLHTTFTTRKLYCLKKNKDGSPSHPLYLLNDSELQEWSVYDLD